ncbi:hypothetical protein BD779DRAFT_1675435 [Infundibulicybe gibba]|nr:hypothetical protein BD779DRAFT_1675435 [Infundibulicybe gibba]
MAPAGATENKPTFLPPPLPPRSRYAQAPRCGACTVYAPTNTTTKPHHVVSAPLLQSTHYVAPAAVTPNTTTPPPANISLPTACLNARRDAGSVTLAHRPFYIMANMCRKNRTTMLPPTSFELVNPFYPQHSAMSAIAFSDAPSAHSHHLALPSPLLLPIITTASRTPPCSSPDAHSIAAPLFLSFNSFICSGSHIHYILSRPSPVAHSITASLFLSFNSFICFGSHIHCIFLTPSTY